jgi:hypothetical protein
MNARIAEIVNGTTTKTAKIQQLVLMDLTRREIADLIGNGNYSFVQNVYAKMLREGLLNQAAVITAAIDEIMIPQEFNKEFGVEFEAYNVSKTTLRNRLIAAGIKCESENYNHTT